MSDTIEPTHRHYKGGLYRVLMSATNERDGTPMVVYQSCETGKVWVRTAHEFNTATKVNGEWVGRFEPVGERVAGD